MDRPQIQELRQAFAAYLPRPATLDSNLEGALSHVLENPGNLVRPQIVLDTSETYAISRENAKDLAIALEYFHTASLLFDDLPAMDNALERRGAPCVHVLFGESGSILAGLALINRAYALTWRAALAFPANLRDRALTYLEDHLGVGGLLAGQSLDLHYSSRDHDLKTTERVACGKTVSLIQLTLVLPALLGGAPDGELRLLERIAKYWGLSYQIVDDLKDTLQSAAESGKTVSRDISLDRPNIANSIGVPAAVKRLERLIDVGDKTLRSLLARRPTLQFLSRLRQGLQRKPRALLRVPMRVPRKETHDVSQADPDQPGPSSHKNLHQHCRYRFQRCRHVDDRHCASGSHRDVLQYPVER